MSDSLRSRLERGESFMARGLSTEPPIGAVVARIRRRRTARRVAVAAVSVAVLVTGAGVASGFFGDANDPAIPTTPSPVTSPSPSASNPSDAQLLEQARAQIVPADAAAADAAFDPVPGPSITVGRVSTVEELGADYVAACGAGPCARLALPPVTPEVLRRLDDSWVVVVDTQYLGALGDPGLELTSLALASPEGEAYSLLDVSAWLDAAGVKGASYYGLALDPVGHGLMLELNSPDAPGQFLVWFDLDTGATTVVTRAPMDSGSLAWTDEGWRVWFGNWPGTPVSALLAPDAQTWSTDGLWAAGDSRVWPYDGAAIVSWPDVANFWYSNGNVWHADPEGQSYCNPIDVTSTRIVSYCFGSTTVVAYALDLATGEWAQDAALPSFPADYQSTGGSVAVAPLGDGILVNRGADATSLPGVAWWHGGAETHVEAPAGNLWWKAWAGGHEVWLTGAGGIGVVRTDGAYRSVIDGASLPQGGNQFVVPIGTLADS